MSLRPTAQFRRQAWHSLVSLRPTAQFRRQAWHSIVSLRPTAQFRRQAWHSIVSLRRTAQFRRPDPRGVGTLSVDSTNIKVKGQTDGRCKSENWSEGHEDKIWLCVSEGRTDLFTLFYKEHVLFYLRPFSHEGNIRANLRLNFFLSHTCCKQD